MSLDTTLITAIFNAAESHALTSGYFERVNMHEVANPPGNGVTAELWVQRIGPVPAGSGLTSTTGLLILNTRISIPVQAASDYVEPALLEAAAALIGAYSGDFQFGGNIRNVDLMGAHGTPLQAVAGYLQRESVYRIYTLDVPLIVNDLFTQAP